MITIPIAVHNELFHWQLDLFWYSMRQTYGVSGAKDKTRAVIIKRNYPSDVKIEEMQWNLTVPHVMVDSFFDQNVHSFSTGAVPLNIQVGVRAAIEELDDDQVIEVIDCDLIHFRKAPPRLVPDNVLFVSDVYEDWHLKSLSTNRHVISPYFEHQGKGYNGGFVPIIGKVKTFKRIMYEWIAVHVDILKRYQHDVPISWWAGMFALQAACEKAQVKMIAEDSCYIPGINEFSDDHYIGHYSVDKKFDKRFYPNVNVQNFENNLYYDTIKDWMYEKNNSRVSGAS